MRDNIFFLSDASYCDNAKTATIAVFNCFSKERFIKKLFDIKNLLGRKEFGQRAHSHLAT